MSCACTKDFYFFFFEILSSMKNLELRGLHTGKIATQEQLHTYRMRGHRGEGDTWNVSVPEETVFPSGVCVKRREKLNLVGQRDSYVVCSSFWYRNCKGDVRSIQYLWNVEGSLSVFMEILKLLRANEDMKTENLLNQRYKWKWRVLASLWKYWLILQPFNSGLKLKWGQRGMSNRYNNEVKWRGER